MKALRIVGLLGIAALTGGGVALALTNPETAEYEVFATETLTEYLQAEGCTEAPGLVAGMLEGMGELPDFLNDLPGILGEFAQDQCISIVGSPPAQAWLKGAIADNTERQNFGVLSIYRTDLSVAMPPPLRDDIPTYFETVGVFNDFYPYKAEQRSPAN
jgi:hypothetical protein